MTPMPAARALEQYFLDARSRVLDLAAVLDRLDRGAGTTDPRLAQLRRGIETLLEGDAGRAERVQQVFSLAYDSNWKRPEPRY